MPLAWVPSRPAAFPGPTEPGEQGRWQKQRRVGELPATSASASASQAEQQSVGWTGLCVCVGVCAWDCAVLGFLFTRLLFEKISNINSDHLNILHLDSIIDFATLVFSLFTLCVSVTSDTAPSLWAFIFLNTFSFSDAVRCPRLMLYIF